MLRRFVCSCTLLSALTANAQIELGFRVYPTPALQHEPAVVQFAIKNNTADTITLGSNGNARLYFDLRSPERHLIRRIPGDIIEPLSVEATETESVSNRVLRGGFSIDPGAYIVEARVEFGGKAFISEPSRVDIVAAPELTKLDAVTRFGSRSFSVRMLDRARHRHIFLRIDDPVSNICYAVIDMGRTVNAGPPTLKLDGEGRVHVLQQASPTRYRHWIVDAYGTIADHESHESPYGQPRLVEDESGELRVDAPESSVEPEIEKPVPFETELPGRR